MTFIEIHYGSPEYRMECTLRDEVLRIPLGMRLADDDLSSELHQRHFGLLSSDSSLVACAIVVAISSQESKIRQMAVRPDFQGKGYGRILMVHLMQRIAGTGRHQFYLHARAHVSGFYESLGFTPSGPHFDEIGIPHVKMIHLAEPTSGS